MNNKINIVSDVNYLYLNKLSLWDYPIWTNFQYDEISDEDIYSALQDLNLANVDPNLDWEDDMWLLEYDIPENKKHSYRVASLVKEYRKNGKFNNIIELDTFAMDCGFCIPNGHHRIRAYQFLGIDAVPFGLNGDLDELEELVKCAGVE